MKKIEEVKTGRWPLRPMFITILIMCCAFIAREMNAFNIQAGDLYSDASSVLPTAFVSWTTLSNDSDTTTTAVEESIDAMTQPEVQVSTAKTLEKKETEETTTTPDNLSEALASNATTTIVKQEQEEKTTVKENQTEATGFKRYDKVVIATKIHGPHQWLLLEQSICLLHFAYNNKVHYDIVVFSALEVPKEKIEELQKIVAPAKFEIVIDNIGFQEEIQALTPTKRELFLQRCNVSSPVNLTWWSECKDPKRGERTSRLAYNWQAEFRSVRVWEHPALADYRYMFWLDSDGFPSRPFQKDPIEYFIEKEAVIMFENFPQGSDGGKHTGEIVNAFNATACDIHLGDKGHLERNLINREQYEMRLKGDISNCTSMKVDMIHGFGHITDLDFYRQPKVLNGLKSLLGDCFLCRSPDDQLAVTIPAAIYAPEKSLNMRSHGFNLGIAHNHRLDGKDVFKPANFPKYWNQEAKHNYPEVAFQTCRVTAGAR